MGAKMKKKKMVRRAQWYWGWGMVLPTIIGLLVLNIIPIFQTMYQSFFKTGDFGVGNVFVGLANYKTMFSDPNVWQALLNTAKYAIIEVPLSIIIGLLLAVLLNKKIKGKTTFRTIFFLPMVAAPAGVAMVWRWLYNSQFGLINHALNKLGIPSVSWLSNPKIAIVSVAFVGIWSIIGYNMVLFIAGLQEIPRSYYEAAQLDGAGPVRQFFSITVPLLSPTIYFVCVTRIIAALQQFDLIFMMMDETNTAMPQTQTLSYLFYKYSFVQSNKGYGSAIVVLLLAVIMVITLIQNHIEKRYVFYD